MNAEYDFLNWTSFPSSIKITNPSNTDNAWDMDRIVIIPVNPDSIIKIEIMIKHQGKAKDYSAAVNVETRVPVTPDTPAGWAMVFGIKTPPDSFDWTKWTTKGKIPSNEIRVPYACGRATVKGDINNVSWFDDLKIYQDDALIYSNDFNNWAPLIIIPAGIITGVAAIKFIK